MESKHEPTHTHLDQEVRGAVDDLRLLREAVHAVDKARDLHDALDSVQIAQLLCDVGSVTA